MYCNRCGARLQQGMAICSECGARQRARPSTVRCANCGGRAFAELTVCPHCGRNLRPAGPRWLLLLALVAIVALAGLWGLGRMPVDRVRETVLDARGNAQELVQILDAVAVPAQLSEPEPVEEPPAVIAAVPATATSTPTVTPTATELVVTDVFTETAPAIESTPAVTLTLTGEAGATPDEGESYTVASGDSLQSIGARLGIPWEEIASLNSLSASSVLKVGQKLNLPAPTPTPTITLTPTVTGTATVTVEPTATPSATPTRPPGRGTVAPSPTPAPPATVAPTAVASGATTTYRVQTGDTLSTIGARFSVPWQNIATANGITGSTRLNVGQQLIIPLAGPLPTATRRPVTATPTSAPTVSAPQLSAPVLRDPGDSTPFQGDGTAIVLSWQPVIGIPPESQYRVTVKWVQDGAPQETAVNTTQTETRFPPWLFAKADQANGRRYTWSVQVVQPTTDGQGGEVFRPLSPPSPARTLTWN